MTAELARTNIEAHLYMDLHACRCGEAGFERVSSVRETDGGWLCRYHGECYRCGREREFEFRTPDEVVLPAAGGWAVGSEPSQLLDAGEWLWVADRLGDEPAKTDVADPRAVELAREGLASAAGAIDEVLKFLPPDADVVPDTAFWSARGARVRDAEPGRFRRVRLIAAHRAYRRMLAELESLAGMTEPPATYYVRLGPNDTVDHPKALLRRASAPADPNGQALRRDGEWHPTETLARAERGELEDRIVEISADHAADMARQWRAEAGRQERELAAQGRGELGFRVARAVDAVRDEHGMPIITEPQLDEFERISVSMYLKNAPIVAFSWGYGPDPFDPAHLGAVPLSIRTDGLWVWSESLAYFASAHGIRPEPDLMAHMRDRQYRIPEVQHDVLLRAGRLLTG